MGNQKIILLFLSFFFLILIFNYFFLTNFKFLEIFKEYKEIIDNFKDKNFIIFSICFLFFGTIWTIFIGLGTPITIFSGFFLGNLTGTVLSLLCFCIGSTVFFILIKKFFLSKVKNLKLIKNNKKLTSKLRKNEFDYFLLFRLSGGLKLPLIIQNIIPVTFDMKTKNFFLATIFGMCPSTFVNVSIGKGLREILINQDKISFFELLLNSNIYIPLIGILILVALSYKIKKVYFNNI